MATIYQRKSGNWTAEVRRNGRRLVETFSTRKLAEKWARGIEADVERGKITEASEEAKRITLQDAAKQFGDEHLTRLRHEKRERNRLQALLESTGWGNITLADLGSRDVAAYVRKRESNGCRPDTIRLDLALLSRLFKHARQEWGMESLRNPVESVRRPSLRGTARTRRLEPGEEEKLLTHAHADLRPVILWALATSMRREEIASLTWEDIDIAKRTAHLPRTKNGEPRSVPMSSSAVEILFGLVRRIEGQVFKTGEDPISTQWAKETDMPHDLVWPEIDLGAETARGLPLSTPAMEILREILRRIPAPVFGLTKDQITDRMRVTVKRAQLSNLRFHDIRHEATSRLFERGTLDMMEIASITGHKTLSMLRRYTHLRAEDLAQKLG